MKKLLTRTAICVAMTHSNVYAEQYDEIREKFSQLAPFNILSVQESPHKELIEIVTEKGIFYSTRNAEYIISGSLHNFEPGLKNLTKERTEELAKHEFAILKDSFLTFKAENEKAEIVVFFDTKCGYCKKLHSEVSQYTANGVTVHYAAWPRDGIYVKAQNGKPAFTQGYHRMKNIWCADNPKTMLNMANRGQQILPATCKNKIPEHFDIGEKLGIRGTPSIFSINGTKIQDGYSPAKQIIKNLKGGA